MSRRAWLPAAMAAVLVLRALHLRSRAEALTTLGPAGPAAPTRAPGRFRLVTVEGCEIDDETLAAAEAHAAAAGLDVVDLVPGGLDAERVLDVVRAVDPARYRHDRLAPGRGANQAVLLSDEVCARVGPLPRRPAPEADLIALVEEAKRCAPTTSDVVLAPGALPSSDRPDRRRAAVRAAWGGMTPVGSAAPLAGLAALGLGVVLSPAWGVLAVAAYCLQPTLALAGTPAAGAPRRALTRPVANLVRAVGLATAADPPAADGTEADPAALRASYEEQLAAGVDRFFEPRSDRCPWCGSHELDAGHVTCVDTYQGKPGTFVLDRCRDCGHVFQNPRLSLAGLDFYYRDFYDGVGGGEIDVVFSADARPYLGRARLVAKHAEAAEVGRWLDVGTGHGHFCLVAADIFPGTLFEALDLSDSVDAALRRGWVAAAHRGLFPKLAEKLAADDGVGFDVVSMHHYLEHTREPREELEAARRVLRPGGLLLVEVPDPECRWGTALRWAWGPWFQPQHQHLVPLGNLAAAVEDVGFTVVASERREAHLPVELASATWLALNRLAPPVGQPWQPPAGHRWATAWRLGVFTLGAPVLGAALGLDRVVAPLVARVPRGTNTYRILARLGEAS